MRLVVDASTLVADLLRVTGRERLADDRLELFIAEHTREEVGHEWPRRVASFVVKRGLDGALANRLTADGLVAVDANVTVVPAAVYLPRESEARWRSERDPNDWCVVAAALVVGGGVWTNDNDFLGTGVPTWTTRTLTAWLART